MKVYSYLPLLRLGGGGGGAGGPWCGGVGFWLKSDLAIMIAWSYIMFRKVINWLSIYRIRYKRFKWGKNSTYIKRKSMQSKIFWNK